jgi:tripartite-type tricarboxylate transporter receptor subunit TctC
VKAIKGVSLLAAAFGTAALIATPAKADFDFAGKQVKIVIGFGVGGTYGKYAQMFADHLKKYIAGDPTIIVESRPGAGGLKALNYVANAMPASGYNYFVPPDTTAIVQLMQPTKAKYDARKCSWIGTANQTNVIVVVRSDTGIKSLDDLKSQQIVMGSTGLASTAYITPNFVNGVLGTKMKVVSGYQGSAKTGLAVEQGEVQGAAFNWLFWKSGYERWFQGDKPFAKAVVQVGYFKDTDLPDVPMLGDVADAKYKPMINFVGTLGLIGRGLAAPAGTPKEAVDVMRAAWNKMISDKAFMADAEKRKLRIISSSGEEVEKVDRDSLDNAKLEVVAEASKMIYGKK